MSNGDPEDLAADIYDRTLLNDRPIGLAVMAATVPEAIWFIVRAFTSTHMEFSAKGRGKCDWLVLSAFMGAVAPRLRFAEATGAPKVFTTLLNLYNVGPVL